MNFDTRQYLGLNLNRQMRRIHRIRKTMTGVRLPTLGPVLLIQNEYQDK